MVWGDSQPNYLCSSPITYEHILSAALQLLTEITKSSGHWFMNPPVHRRRSCSSPLPPTTLREGSLGKDRRAYLPLCDVADAFRAGWDCYRPEQKVSLSFSLQSQTKTLASWSCHFIQLRGLHVWADGGWRLGDSWLVQDRKVFSCSKKFTVSCLPQDTVMYNTWKN